MRATIFSWIVQVIAVTVLTRASVAVLGGGLWGLRIADPPPLLRNQCSLPRCVSRLIPAHAVLLLMPRLLCAQTPLCRGLDTQAEQEQEQRVAWCLPFTHSGQEEIVYPDLEGTV